MWGLLFLYAEGGGIEHLLKEKASQPDDELRGFWAVFAKAYSKDLLIGIRNSGQHHCNCIGEV